MPKYDTSYWSQEQLKVWLRPNGFRRLCPRFIFFLSGDILDLELCVKSKNDSVQEYKYTWELQEWSNREYWKEKQSSGSLMTSPRGTAKVQLDTHLLQHEGEYHLIVSMYRANKPEEQRVQTLLNFKVLAYDTFYTDIFKTLMSGFIGAILGLIAGLLLTR